MTLSQTGSDPRVWKFRVAFASLTILAMPGPAIAADERFTIAVIPDTQNYVDYRHQRAEGFPFDASELFLEQMRYIAENVESAGGEIAFVTSVGDVWQNQSAVIDPAHVARGFARVSNPAYDKYFAPTPKTRSLEMPMARAGYRLLSGKVPFSVVPGNRDYDAIWLNQISAGRAAPPGLPGAVHLGGLDNFRTVFGSASEFFRGRRWYVASHDGGADSAQVFTAGGYRFLHIGLQFDPPTASLEWAASIMRRYPGLPTIVSTHDYMNKEGQRLPSPVIDAAAIDPKDNSPEMIWQKLISQNDQIFMVLSGHQPGQAVRIDVNGNGNKVYQILADYQDRAQTAKDAGLSPGQQAGIGDGWMRLMEFDFSSTVPAVRVRTYSTRYKLFSVETPQYAAWYKRQEKPNLSDEAFHREDDFRLDLTDFRMRFDAKAKIRK